MLNKKLSILVRPLVTARRDGEKCTHAQRLGLADKHFEL